jgi:DNA-binding NtrC family response regulator
VAPRILIIDDLYGRALAGRPNPERKSLCGKYLLEDVTPGPLGSASTARVKHPVARAVFHRGQLPLCASEGDHVRNDLDSVIQIVRGGWIRAADVRDDWALVLLDLEFKTGIVTAMSNDETEGMPLGEPEDSQSPHYFGIRILEALHLQFPDLPVVVFSSMPEADVRTRYAELGARGFLDKSAGTPEDLERLIRYEGLVPDESGEILGHSRKLLIALRDARVCAAQPENIHIHGERGSGKDLLARYLHRHTLSGSGERPFVTVDCGTLSPELFASALFGHVKGAFTGAIESRRGAVSAANGGDLFLDEIGNLPPAVQDGVLRVTDQHEVTPVGGKAESIQVRFISATNTDLQAAAASGRFRDDLVDRLCKGGVIELPPLRERLEDQPRLVEAFVREAEESVGARAREIPADTLAFLADCQWSGNIRELKSQVFQAVQRNREVPVLVPRHFPLRRESPVVALVPGPPLADGAPPQAQPVDATVAGEPAPPLTDSAGSLGRLVAELHTLDFAALPQSEIVGRLPALQEAWAQLMVRYLKACLDATRERTARNPEGRFVVTRAVGFLLRSDQLDTTKAYDVVNSIARVGSAAEATDDAELRAVFEQARKRGRRSRGADTQIQPD